MHAVPQLRKLCLSHLRLQQQQLWAQRGSVMSWRCWSRENPASLKAGLLYRLCKSVMLYSLARSSNDLVHNNSASAP